MLTQVHGTANRWSHDSMSE